MSNLHLLDQPIAEIAQNSAAVLASIEEELKAAKALLKRRDEQFQAALTRMYGTAAAQAYVTKGVDSGTARIPASNSLELKLSRSKEVVWDTEELKRVAKDMTLEQTQHFLKVSLEVPEKVYAAAEPIMREKFRKARQVKVGATKFSFATNKLADAA